MLMVLNQKLISLTDLSGTAPTTTVFA